LETFVDICVSETENSEKTSEEAAHASCSVQNVSLDSYVSKKNTFPKHDKYIDLVSPQDIVFARSESGNIC
jgi:hypothetical protein